jgi:hypothetical protein
MITEEQREILADIFVNTEAIASVTIALDTVSRSVVITYEDLDDEWFNELVAATLT